eukprot:PhF_6_TR19138/c0_g1_i1/m.28154
MGDLGPFYKPECEANVEMPTTVLTWMLWCACSDNEADVERVSVENSLKNLSHTTTTTPSVTKRAREESDSSDGKFRKVEVPSTTAANVTDPQPVLPSSSNSTNPLYNAPPISAPAVPPQPPMTRVGS